MKQTFSYKSIQAALKYTVLSKNTKARQYKQYGRGIWNVGVTTFHLHPSAKMQCTTMEHVEVFSWQVMDSEHKERANPD